MRLLNCNVQNFGTLSGFKVDFNEGLTVIKEENGFGKSTLACFIKAMFYGLLQTSKRSLDENERKKYTPWQGGAFGGTLDFECNGKRYRVERFFGAKEKADTFRLLDLSAGNLCSDFSENLGLELFGIDADSFERSVYMPQTATATGINNSLRAKLTGLVENSDDISNYDNAVKALEKRAKEYSVANGARGAIADKTREINELEAELKDIQASADNLKRVKNELCELKVKTDLLTGQKAKIREQITAASDAAARAEQVKRREELKASVTELNSRLQAVKLRYPDGFPNEQALAEANETAELLKSTENQLVLLKSEMSDSGELERLKEFFHESVPNEQEIADCRDSLTRLTQAKANANALSDRISQNTETSKPGGKAFKLSLIAAVLLAAAGAVTMIWQMLAGVIIIALSVVVAGVAAFQYLKNMISTSGTHGNAAVQQEYETLKTQIAELSDSVAQFTGKYVPDAESQAALDTISQNLRDFKRVQKSVNEREQKIASRLRRIGECREQLESFFKSYGIGLEGNFTDRLSAVKRDIETVTRLENELKQQNTRLSELPTTQEQPTVTDEIQDREKLLEAEKQLTDGLDEIQRQISVCEADANRLSAKAETFSDIEERLENLRLERDEMTDKLNVINKTLELLGKAKNDLSLRYLDRITDGFNKYSSIIKGQSEEALIDTELKVMVGCQGVSRDREYFSIGYKDMIDIAMRLALCDALFDKECPMLILDDPFVNLDDRRMANSIGMLKKLAEHRQIVYLTCHSSRC